MLGSCFVFSEDHLGHSVGRLGKECVKLLTQLVSAYCMTVRVDACFMSKDYMSRAGEPSLVSAPPPRPLPPCPTPFPPFTCLPFGPGVALLYHMLQGRTSVQYQ